MNITTLDYIVCFFYLPIIYVFLYSFSKKRYGNSILQKYFIWGITVKLVGAISMGLVYEYYYRMGDTFGFFRMGNFFSEIIQKDPSQFYNVLISGDPGYFQTKGYELGFSSYYAFHPATIIIARFCALINFISLQLYLPTSIFFALFSFSGLWKLFRVFSELYSGLIKEFAVFILFIPSLFFWGSGILKDTITIGALGWLTWACYSLLIKREKFLIAFPISIASFYLIFQIKSYIAIAYLPAVIAWILFTNIKIVNQNSIRKLLGVLFILLLIGSFIIINIFLSGEIIQGQLEAVLEQANTTQKNIGDLGAGSSYSLGEIESNSFRSFLKIIFPALIVTLFRPFIWEVNNPLSLLSCLESTFFLWMTLYVIWKVGIKKFFLTIFNQPTVLYCLLFAVMFAIPVGIASQNFGTLVRYKIPCLPFYLIGLSLIYYHNYGRGILNVGNRAAQLHTERPMITSH